MPAPEPPARGCAKALTTFASSATHTGVGALFGLVQGLDLGSLLAGSGGPAPPVPPGPSPVPEPDQIVAPLIGASVGPGHGRGGGPADAVLPTRWTLRLVLGRGLHVPPAVWQPDFVPLQVERPG